MPDYKAMYFHLAGRMASAVETLEATTNALVAITEGLKRAQQSTEEMFINSGDDETAPNDGD
ncbi:MAG: hypothetical protein LBN97_06430 [Oscillospiraceae bacterium]|jgi:hypothetical protein|nr:hypothetical protein [Oscillospiraceae bacterium]